MFFGFALLRAQIAAELDESRIRSDAVQVVVLVDVVGKFEPFVQRPAQPLDRARGVAASTRFPSPMACSKASMASS
jgi:hypothetical protein